MNRDFLIRHATLRQLQILVSVAYTQSYTQAAKNLHLTQPSVSIQIQKLGNAVGMPLFDCVGKKLYLTGAGERVLQAAEEILDRLGHLSDDIIEMKGEIKGDIKIASVSNSIYFMPRLLGSFLQLYPDVKPYLMITNRQRVIDRIQNNEDEIYLIGQVPEYLDVIIYPFIENTLVVAAAKGHPLEKVKKISLQQIIEQRVLLREPGSGTRQAVDDQMSKYGYQINAYMELGSGEAIKQAVMADLGISVMTLNNIQLELQTGHLVILDVEGFPLKRHWNLMHLKSRKLSLVAKTYLEFMLNEAKTVSI